MSELKKSLDLKDLILFGFSSILGSGGFNLIGQAVRAGGSQWPLLFGIATVLLLGTAWSYTRAYRLEGTNTSESDVIRDVFGFSGEWVGIGGILLNNIISISVVLTFIAELLFPNAGWGGHVLFSTAILGGMAGFSLLGIDVNKEVIGWATWMLLVVLTGAMGLGGWSALKGRPVADGVGAPRSLSQSLMYFFFILEGADSLMKFVEESVDAPTDIPRAITSSTIVSAVLVFGIAIALGWVPGLTDKQEHNALGYLFAHFVGPNAIGAMSALMIFFMLVTTFVEFLAMSRYMYSLGKDRDGGGLKWLTRLNAAQVPWAAVAVVFAISFVGILINNVGTLVRIANVGLIAVMGLVATAVATIDWSSGSVVSAVVNALTAAGYGGLMTAAVL